MNVANIVRVARRLLRQLTAGVRRLAGLRRPRTRGSVSYAQLRAQVRAEALEAADFRRAIDRQAEQRVLWPW